MSSDPYAKRLFWFIFAGTRGGINRIRIILVLKEEPMNMNQISKKLSLDYKAIQHHIRILEKNNLLKSEGKKYGVTYLPSTFLEENMGIFNDIARKLDKNK